MTSADGPALDQPQPAGARTSRPEPLTSDRDERTPSREERTPSREKRAPHREERTSYREGRVPRPKASADRHPSDLDVLLVGGGHTHLHLLRRATELAAAGVRLRLLAPAHLDYSGSAAAAATGALEPDAGRIDVAGLARRAGVHHLDDRLVHIEPGPKRVQTADGQDLTYDVASLNLGSVVATEGMFVAPTVARVKPLAALAPLRGWLDTVASSRAPGTLRVHVIGGGATGLELAGNLAARLGRLAREAVGAGRAEVHLLERRRQVGASLPAAARRRLVRRLHERGVVLHTGVIVTRVAEDHLVVDGEVRPHSLAVVATGLVAPEVVRSSGLGDERGVLVRATLQHRDHDDVYAVGDCAWFLPSPLPRLGVHGVRQGPVLAASLVARRRGDPLPAYSPPRQPLQILDLGGGRALAVKGRWWVEGRGALQLKRAIDRRWLAQHAAGRGPG